MSLLAVMDLLLEQSSVYSQGDHATKGVVFRSAETAAIGRHEVRTDGSRTATAPRTGSVFQARLTLVTPGIELGKGSGTGEAARGINEID